MKDRSHKKALITVICILLLIVFGIFLQFFVLGEPVDRTQVYCTTSVNGQSLELRVAAIESGVSLRGWKFKQDGGTLLISARKVLVSPLFDKGDYETIINLKTIDNISFGGQEIWSNKAVPTAVFDKPVNDLDGVSMKVISASPTFASLEILNTTDLKISYGSDYDLQVFQNGEWYSLSYLIDDWGFTAEGYNTIKNVPSEFGINWESFHGTLSEGDYRIVKGVNDFRGSGDFTIYYLAAEFRIN